MYALIYDEHDLKKPKKQVISVHKTRETAESALEQRKKILGINVLECNARIVWVHSPVSAGEYITAASFETWAPDEEIPWGDRVSDGD